MASTITGTVASVSVSGITITGTGGELGECSITEGKERAKFNPVGTNISMHATGMKTVEGSMTKRWVATASEFASGSAQLYQQLLDGDEEFAIVMSATGGGTTTVSGCMAQNIARRTAPGTETELETLTFTGTHWS